MFRTIAALPAALHQPVVGLGEATNSCGSACARNFTVARKRRQTTFVADILRPCLEAFDVEAKVRRQRPGSLFFVAYAFFGFTALAHLNVWLAIPRR